MKMNVRLLSILLLAFGFAACTVDDDEDVVSDVSVKKETTLSAVTISGASSISYNGTASLSAVATAEESTTISYTWSITSGDAYASLSATSGETVTLTANNTTDSKQSISIKVVASDGIGSCENTHEVTVAANGTTVDNAVTAVTVSKSTVSVSVSGSTTLTANPTLSGSISAADVSYSWSIESGEDYISLSNATAQTVTITGTNTTKNAQAASVKVSASYGGKTVTSESVSVTVAAKAATSASYNASSTVSPSYENVIYVDVGSALVSADNATWTEVSTSAAKFFSDAVKVKFTEEASGASTGLLRINAAAFSGSLAVYISGTNSTDTIGGIKLQTNGNDAVIVYLNDAKITSTNYPCLDITKGAAATIVLSGTNTFVDGRSYGTGYGEEYSTTSGATYTDDEGTTQNCTVVQTAVSEGSDHKGTLYNKADLTISGSGSMSVTQAYKNCIASKDGVLTVNGGTFTLKNYTSTSTTGKNGMFGGQGIVVNDGAITFNGYGIITTSDLRKANAFKTDDDTYTSSYVNINGGTVEVTTYNGKGINAPVVTIAGGTNTFTVTGTTSYAERTSSGTWYDADGVKETGTVKFAPEGIEGSSSITISGGTTIVSAPDDGINVSNTGGALTISGGFLYVKSKGDGLDSNGNIKVTNGVVVVSQTGGGNSPIDCGDGNYTFTVTGGTVLALGSSDMFSESIPSSTSNAMVYSTSLGSSSSSFAVSNGNTNLVALKSPQTYAAAIFVSSNLTSGTSYSFVKGGTISGTEYVSDTGFYLPATGISGGTTTSVTASTSKSSSSGGNTPGGNQGGPGGRPW